MDLIRETKFIMNKYNITASKSLGQNFLVDSEVVYGIVDSAEVSKDDLIIEIGPGLGTLTSVLLEKAGKRWLKQKYATDYFHYIVILK